MNQNSGDSRGNLVCELLKARQQNREIAAQIDAVLQMWCEAVGHDYDELKARAAAMDNNDEPGDDLGLLDALGGAHLSHSERAQAFRAMVER